MTLKLIALIMAFVVVGAPMVYVLWSFVNEALTGHLEAGLAVIFLPVLAVFAGLLVFLGRWARRQGE